MLFRSLSRRLLIGAACILSMGLAAVAWAGQGWMRFALDVETPEQAQRLGDSTLRLFSDNIAIGRTDIALRAKDLPELWALGIRFEKVSDLPDMEGWDRNYAGAQADYKTEYLRYNDIIAQYEAWRLAHPKLITRVQIGSSWGNRPLYAYRIWNPVIKVGGASLRKPKNSFLITATQHAREWISTSVPMYICDTLITKVATETTYQNLLNKFAVYIVPVMNPDGYEYSWTNDRMWRKNRRNNGGGSYGVDLNRNFSVGWGQNGGSSGNSNSETYRGPSAFSEPETSALKNWAATVPSIKGTIDFHSYSELILWPWGYTTSQSQHHSWFNTLATNMRNAMVQGGGHSYTIGQTSTTLYIASGIAPDYFYGTYGSAGFTIELRDTGQYGFLLPPSQILPTVKEAWSGFDSLLKQL